MEHGGRVVAKVLKSRGVTHLFTLSGGHLFSIYDGCKEEGIEIVDVRHEQTAAFAAEGFAKATRRVGVAALTAGPGVTNGVSAIAGAQANCSPVCVLGGRAPEMRWGSGSLQEFDHVPVVEPLGQVGRDGQGPGRDRGADRRRARPGAGGALGPDLRRLSARRRLQRGATPRSRRPPPPSPVAAEGVEEAAALLAGAERPVVMAGTGLYWGTGRGRAARRSPRRSGSRSSSTASAAAACPPTMSSASAAPAAPASRAPTSPSSSACRSTSGSDSARASARRRRSSASTRPPNALTANRLPDLDLVGDVAASLAAIREAAGGDPGRTRAWREQLRKVETEKREAERAELEDPRSPLHPVRVYNELGQVLDRDAIVVGDGGDFVSYAGRFIDTYEPGCWMDPGPFGCLGAGPGQAIGAKLAHPERQVCLLLGDGAFGFAGIEFDTMARHGLGVVGVMGNNGIWALEHHPMKFLYGYSVAAELRPETRYDEMVEALGCDGILVREPEQLRPALEQAFSSGRPTLVNVLTDPEVVYPRKSNLA